MSVKFDSGRKKKSPEFSAAIGLCLAAVCLVAAATAINSGIGKKNDDSSYIQNYVSEENDSVWLGVEDTGEDEEVYTDVQSPQNTEDNAQNEVPVSGDAAAADTAVPDETDNAEDAFAQLPDTGAPESSDLSLDGSEEAVPASAAISYRMPLSGEIIKEYSGDELVYCSTMCDWRVHQGIDISGTADCEVYAAADGVVVDFVEDMLYGYTAIIRQNDDSMLYYCGLSSVPMVTKGLEVHAGDVIGYLGIVPCEANDPPHLHLAMMKDGSFVNPLPAMGL